MPEEKPVKCIILDAGPIILNDPPISSLLIKSDELYSTSTVISEIRDAAARARLETTIRPFLKIRNPSPASLKVVSDFSRRTGDFAVLSKPDLEILALAYELECERNGGDWRLRRASGQKSLNGPAPGTSQTATSSDAATTQQITDSVVSTTRDGPEPVSGPGLAQDNARSDDATLSEAGKKLTLASTHETRSPSEAHGASNTIELGASEKVQDVSDNSEPGTIEPESTGTHSIEADTAEQAVTGTEASEKDKTPPDMTQSKSGAVDAEEQVSAEEDDDSGGEWITPSNLASKKAKDAAGPENEDLTSDQPIMEVATITSDYAMQNVLLQMNLNLLSPALRRVKHIKSHILRCHGCFATSKDMSKQFCARCGKPTLTRVACSTKSNGTFALHLKKNFQYNKRGDRYSIPKPVAGSANGRVQGGGKGGWGNELILTEDQKEFTRASRGYERSKQQTLMDEDYLPNILTGNRGTGGGGKPKVGAGRNVNSKKR